uniref:NADH dehydrogenase subunit 4L n=1 Tax=Megabalanus coccopoma TaxID=864464 RepID=UPI00226CCD3A|nr:NADH dehydrogenase subunit 4L [Megabalanus coccopoma]UZN92557.1 NADH dehydrogenase subunit 4L [Megabalanus coccopoma]
MTNFFLALPVFFFLVGTWIYISKRKHLMNMLISLEYIVLTIFLLLMLSTIKMGVETYVSLLFLVASVCEGSLGVGMMVTMVRSHGSDYISCFSMLKC